MQNRQSLQDCRAPAQQTDCMGMLKSLALKNEIISPASRLHVCIIADVVLMPTVHALSGYSSYFLLALYMHKNAQQNYIFYKTIFSFQFKNII